MAVDQNIFRPIVVAGANSYGGTYAGTPQYSTQAFQATQAGSAPQNSNNSSAGNSGSNPTLEACKWWDVICLNRKIGVQEGYFTAHPGGAGSVTDAVFGQSSGNKCAILDFTCWLPRIVTVVIGMIL